MSVTVTLTGRLGNNLFQYAFARIVATRLGLALDCHVDRRGPWQREPSSEDSTLDRLARFFPNVRRRVDGARHVTPVQSFEIDKACSWRGQRVNLEDILADTRPRWIRLKGFFQRFEYFTNHHDDLRDWFRTTPLAGTLAPGPADVLLNVRRGGDYRSRGWLLPLTYYDRALDLVAPAGRVFVCGVGIDRDVQRHLAKFSPTYLAGSAIHQFAAIQRFNRIILSNSTFGWWAAYLSAATLIVGPRSSDGACYAFTGFGDVDLHMRQQRYRELEVPGD
jgi:hypothetical protein